MTISFVGHAIVSADGMIADSEGHMPTALRDPADWRRFQASLDAAALVVLGRKAHERHLNPGRRRLVVTHRVPAVAPDPNDIRSAFWNPEGASLEYVLEGLGISDGTIAITGLFDLFVGRLDAFDLAEVNNLVLPRGRPCFADGHPRTVLTDIGLRPVSFGVLDAGTTVTLTRWARP
ncbi:MAG TPA: dihydrofolate reductase [Devosia sp.]|nr:dihydrofolate reductase [Devosia sp.]